MAKRRKNRTHLKGAGGAAAAAAAAGIGSKGAPRTFVVKHGPVGSSVAQLVRDVRKIMEPNTATRLRERKRNKLKDFLTLAPSLGVTHLLAFTLTPVAPSFRIIKLSAGPTLSFRVVRYSLVKDLLNHARQAKSVGVEYLSPPLLVLASFPPANAPDTPPHLPLVMKTFQSLLPPLAPTEISLSSARRVVLVSYNAERATIDVRHYLISVRAAGVSRRVRRVLETGGPRLSSVASSTKVHGLDLRNVKDVADYVLGSRIDGEDGYETAASTSAASEGEENSVRLASDYTGRNNRGGEKRAVRLDEIGPRLELKLVKITEGVPGNDGAVLWHEFVQKGPAEVAALTKAAVERARLKKQRREEQERNVQRKQASAGVVVDESTLHNESNELDDVGSDADDDWGCDEDVSEGSEEGSDGEESDGVPAAQAPKRRKQ